MTTRAARGKPAAVPPLLRVEVTTKTLVTVVAVVGVACIALKLAPVVLVVVTSLFVVGTLNPAVEWLEARGIKRGIGIGISFASVLVAGIGLLAVTLPTLVAQLADLVHQEPALRGHLADALARSRLTAPLAESLRHVDYQALMKSSAAVALEYSGKSAELIAYFASAVFLALYVMIDRDRLRGGLFAVVPRTHHIRLSRVLLNLEVIVGGYIRGQLLTSGLMALFTFALLTACRVKTALAIGVVAGMADVLPYVGVFLSVGPAVGAALARGPMVVAIVLGAMLAYEELENRVLVPRIYGSALKLPSSVVLFSLLVGGTLMGIAGALLALPVAAALRMLIEELRIELPGEDVDDALVRAEDARVERQYEKLVQGVPAEAAAAIAVEISEGRAR